MHCISVRHPVLKSSRQPELSFLIFSYVFESLFFGWFFDSFQIKSLLTLPQEPRSSYQLILNVAAATLLELPQIFYQVALLLISQLIKGNQQFPGNYPNIWWHFYFNIFSSVYSTLADTELSVVAVTETSLLIVVLSLTNCQKCAKF